MHPSRKYKYRSKLPAARSEAEGRLQLDCHQSEPLQTYLLLYLLYLITIVFCICFIWNYLSLSPHNYIVPVLWIFPSPIWSSPNALDERVAINDHLTCFFQISNVKYFCKWLQCSVFGASQKLKWNKLSLRTRFSGNSTQLNFNSNQITYKITLETASHISFLQNFCQGTYFGKRNF